jgi:hypothetical protein
MFPRHAGSQHCANKNLNINASDGKTSLDRSQYVVDSTPVESSSRHRLTAQHSARLHETKSAVGGFNLGRAVDQRGHCPCARVRLSETKRQGSVFFCARNRRLIGRTAQRYLAACGVARPSSSLCRSLQLAMLEAARWGARRIAGSVGQTKRRVMISAAQRN